MSTLKLIKEEFTHIPEISVYNHNYYENKDHSYKILEGCNDDSIFDFYLVDDHKEIFLGSAHNSIKEQDLLIEFKVYWT